jgi:hypothetical protein
MKGGEMKESKVKGSEGKGMEGFDHKLRTGIFLLRQK